MLTIILALLTTVGAAPIEKAAVATRVNEWLNQLTEYRRPPTDVDGLIVTDLLVRVRPHPLRHVPSVTLEVLDYTGDADFSGHDRARLPAAGLVAFGQTYLPDDLEDLRQIFWGFERLGHVLKPRVAAKHRLLVNRAAVELLDALTRLPIEPASSFRRALYLAQMAEVITPLLERRWRAEGTPWLVLDAAITLRRAIAAAYPGGPGADHSTDRAYLNRRWFELAAAIENRLLATCGKLLGI
jgi:hypothetical protein